MNLCTVLVLLSAVLFLMIICWDEESKGLVSAQRGKKRKKEDPIQKQRGKQRRKARAKTPAGGGKGKKSSTRRPKGRKGKGRAGGSRGRGGRGRDAQEEPARKEEKDTRLKCFVCTADFTTTRLNPNDLCYDPYLNETLATDLYMVSCPQISKYCSVDIAYINYAFTKVIRNCGSTNCMESCVINGFGLDYTTCTSCCPESGSRIRQSNTTTTPNPDDEYEDDEDSSEKTTTTMSPEEAVRQARMQSMIGNRNCA